MNPFRGELGRLGYLVWTILSWAFLVANGVLIDVTKHNHKGNYWLGYRVIVLLVFFVVYLLATFRRVQNTGLNPWWFLLTLVPYVNLAFWIALLFVPKKYFKES